MIIRLDGPRSNLACLLLLLNTAPPNLAVANTPARNSTEYEAIEQHILAAISRKIQRGMTARESTITDLYRSGYKLPTSGWLCQKKSCWSWMRAMARALSVSSWAGRSWRVKKSIPGSTIRTHSSRRIVSCGELDWPRL